MTPLRDKGLDSVLGRTLRVGTLLAAVIILLGVGLGVLGGRHAEVVAPPATFDSAAPRGNPLQDIVRGISALEPASLVMLGVLVLLATPMLRVVACGIVFVGRRDWLYGTLAALIAITLALGLAGAFD